jgi:hypothetical protein
MWNELLHELQSGLAECVASERTAPTMFSSVPVTGMFKIRRTVAVSSELQEIVLSVLRGDKEIRLHGIRIVVPTTRRHVFDPPLPVYVEALGTELNVSVASVELVEQDEQPALLITTESVLKPNLLVVLAVLPDEPKPDEQFPVDDVTDRALFDLEVPKQHHTTAKRAMRHAWRHGIAQGVMSTLPKWAGVSDRRDVEVAAKAIVQQLVEQKVVSAGFLFWMRLGYWLVKIVMALLEAQQIQEAKAAGIYLGQSTTMRRGP